MIEARLIRNAQEQQDAQETGHSQSWSKHCQRERTQTAAVLLLLFTNGHWPVICVTPTRTRFVTWTCSIRFTTSIRRAFALILAKKDHPYNTTDKKTDRNYIHKAKQKLGKPLGLVRHTSSKWVNCKLTWKLQNMVSFQLKSSTKRGESYFLTMVKSAKMNTKRSCDKARSHLSKKRNAIYLSNTCESLS